MRQFLIGLLSFVWLYSHAQPPAPNDKQWVYDGASILSPAEEELLSQQLETLEAQSSVEFVVGSIPSLNGASIKTYANEWARSWGIGKAEKDNGILLLLVVKDRKMRLEIGYGLENKISDLEASQLINELLKLKMRIRRHPRPRPGCGAALKRRDSGPLYGVRYVGRRTSPVPVQEAH